MLFRSQWYHTDGNVLITRHGRVFVKKANGEKHIFAYPQSPWANPFKLSQYSMAESLKRYDAYLEEKLKNKKTLEEFLKLKNAKEIGCFCAPNSQCHRNVILQKLEKYSKE